MSQPNIETKLREALDGVTPGPWYSGKMYGWGDICITPRPTSEYGPQGTIGGAPVFKAIDGAAHWENKYPAEKNAAYIALCSPDNIGALLDTIATLRKQVSDAVGAEAVLASDILAELKRARAKFPGKNVTFAALVEEVGELATATFEESSDRVRKEAVQVAVMAMRMVLDGDHTFDDWRASKGLDALATLTGGKADA